MLFPKKRLRYTTLYQGKTDPDGWIVLDMMGADIEGASKLYLSMADIEGLKAGGDVTSDRLKQARDLLGGDITELPPEDA